MITYQKRLFISFAALFAVFAFVLIGFQWQRERTFRKELLEARLQGYADIIATQRIIKPPHSVDSVRTTVILINGKVLYESNPHLSTAEMGNHIDRPEVKQALLHGEGYDIRHSTTTGEEFFYYAKRYNNRIVREALPFNVSVQHFIRSSSNLFIWVFLLTFAAAFGILFYLSDRFGRTVKDVKKKERARIQKAKRQMTNNITHELRTPIAAIHGYIETLLNSPNLQSDKQRHFLQRALMQSERLTDLIRDVSIISKTEEAPDMLPREQININAIVKDVEDELSQGLHDASITLHNNLPADLVITGNYSLIYSIFRNLIENTIRYAGNGTTACLALQKESKSHYTFEYYDTGHGIAAEHLSRIFERFYRTDQGRTHGQNGGTGLGLSIVRNAILYHRGEIKAYNRTQGGLLFHFTLHK